VSDDARAWLAGRSPEGPALDVVWGRGAHRLALSLYATSEATPDALTTSVRGVLFRRRCVMVLRDPGGDHVMPGGRREPGETLMQTLVREIAEETGWRFSSARAFAALHFRHLTPKPDGYPYPYPDFFQPLFVLEAGDYDRRRIVRDDWETRSRMTPIARAAAVILAEQKPILTLALAARAG
jgi:8-oxo-dGTP pyrophosphatase MutT (NUDIX family)